MAQRVARAGHDRQAADQSPNRHRSSVSAEKLDPLEPMLAAEPSAPATGTTPRSATRHPPTGTNLAVRSRPAARGTSGAPSPRPPPYRRDPHPDIHLVRAAMTDLDNSHPATRPTTSATHNRPVRSMQRPRPHPRRSVVEHGNRAGVGDDAGAGPPAPSGPGPGIAWGLCAPLCRRRADAWSRRRSRGGARGRRWAYWPSAGRAGVLLVSGSWSSPSVAAAVVDVDTFARGLVG